MHITFRPAAPADKPRILAIAAQVWEGDDYVPYVIDEWLAAGSARLIVACVEDALVGFARYLRVMPGYAWFEGMRTDPAWEGRGVAKALMAHLLALARADGAARVGASTYLDNLASQHILEVNGFTQVAGFVYCQSEPGERGPGIASPSAEVMPVPPDEASAYIGRSRFLADAQGFLPHGWRFYPFTCSPETALGQMQHLWGVRRAGAWAALLCVGAPTHGPHVFTIDFVDGDAEAMRALCRHALHLAGPGTYVGAMIPRPGAETSPALAILRDLGLQVWNDSAADVFVYERPAL